jgi:hypothetical protein
MKYSRMPLFMMFDVTERRQLLKCIFTWTLAYLQFTVPMKTFLRDCIEHEHDIVCLKYLHDIIHLMMDGVELKQLSAKRIAECSGWDFPTESDYLSFHSSSPSYMDYDVLYEAEKLAENTSHQPSENIASMKMTTTTTIL